MEQLNDKELETLIDCVKAWEKVDMERAMTSSLMSIMLPTPEDSSESRSEARQARVADIMSDAEAKVALRSETSILLQAKLIRMKNTISMEEIVDG